MFSWVFGQPAVQFDHRLRSSSVEKDWSTEKRAESLISMDETHISKGAVLALVSICSISSKRKSLDE